MHLTSAILHSLGHRLFSSHSRTDLNTSASNHPLYAEPYPGLHAQAYSRAYPSPYSTPYPAGYTPLGNTHLTTKDPFLASDRTRPSPSENTPDMPPPYTASTYRGATASGSTRQHQPAAQAATRTPVPTASAGTQTSSTARTSARDAGKTPAVPPRSDLPSHAASQVVRRENAAGRHFEINRDTIMEDLARQGFDVKLSTPELIRDITYKDAFLDHHRRNLDHRISMRMPQPSPLTWPGAEEKRAAPRSYGDAREICSPRTLDALRHIVDVRNIRPDSTSIKPLSPTQVKLAPLYWRMEAMNRGTTVLYASPRQTPVTVEQAKALQIMQMTISAARQLMPNSSRQIDGLYRSGYVAHVAGKRLDNFNIDDYNEMVSGLDKNCLDRDEKRTESLARVRLAASNRVGNSSELGVFCFYALAAMPEFKNYHLRLLYSPELDRTLLTTEIGGRTFVCDAWPEFPMAAPADMLISSYRKAFFSPSKQQIVTLEKKPGQTFTPMPMKDLAATAAEHKALTDNQTALLREYPRAEDYAEVAEAIHMNNEDERSVLYTSPPGLEYVVDDGTRFNLRYLYGPNFTQR